MNETSLEGIAIIGMSGRFPGAPDLETFWQNIRSGKEAIETFSDQELKENGVSPELLSHPQYVKAGTRLPGADRFDAAFFGYLPREAELMDPQQRLFLQHSWEALEHAGYAPLQMTCPVGVFAGASLNSYLLRNLATHPGTRDSLTEFGTMLANDKDFLSVRVSYKLNLKGPSLSIQTACSTSLVAVVQAVQALQNFQCDLALAGGAAVHAPLAEGYLYKEGMILSPDGRCRPFDADARGTVPGCGVGVVVLKRLADAMESTDTIWAVIRGAAINNDGSGKVGFTAPSVDGQAECIATAQAMAGVDPETIGYVETHGTGTPLGDPIEVEALTRAFRAQTSRKQFCAMGSLKSMMGHPDAAAGVAGLMKLVLALHHREIPPSLNFSIANPKIDFPSSPFYVNTELRPWPAGTHPRRGAVSSFGIGGTNAHCVLEEAPVIPVPSPAPGNELQLMVCSAKTAAALGRQIARLGQHFVQYPNTHLSDAAFTLQQGRSHFRHRAAVVSGSGADAATALLEESSKRRIQGEVKIEHAKVAFLFPGQGNQYARMGAELFQHFPVFRSAVERCIALFNPLLGVDLREGLFPSTPNANTGQIHETRFAQPALFTTEYATAQLWMSLGVKPALLVGHSIGEYVAAVLAGVFSLEDAIRLLSLRARLMQSLPGGSMLAAKMSASEIEALIAGRPLALAASNSPTLSVVSGPTPEVESFQQELARRKCAARMLPTSHAFHSPMMEPIMAAFTAEVHKITRHGPRIPMESTLTGKRFTDADAMDAGYWARQLRFAVRFADVAAHLVREPDWILLEAGPGQSLGSHIRQQPARDAAQVIVGTMPVQPESGRELESFLSAAGKLWCTGVELDFLALRANATHRRIPLPTYPWEPTRHWIDAQPRLDPSIGSSMDSHLKQEIAPSRPPSEMQSADSTGSELGVAGDAELAALTERVIQEQMAIMQEQLEVLRRSSE